VRRLFVALSLVLLLVSPYAAPVVNAQCGTPVPTWTPTPTYQSIVLGTQSANLIAYFPLNETSGTTAYDLAGVAGDGTYSGVTLNATTFPNGDPVPSFDGVNDAVTIPVGAVDTAEGTLLLWFRVTSALWTEGVTRFGLVYEVDGGNRIRLFKPLANNALTMEYAAGGAAKSRTETGLSSTDWLAAALTWSTAADEVKFYLTGAQIGTTLTGLGSWTGTAVTRSISRGNANAFWGSIAHVAIWDTPLDSTEIATLSNVPSPASPTPTVQPTCVGATETPTITPTADLYSFWTAVPPETTGTPEAGQPFAFAYTATAGQIGIAVLLAAILFTMMAVSLITFFRRRK
jgi:hypothetical protein